MFTKFIKIINSHHWGQKAFFDMLNNLKRLKHLDPFSFTTLTIKKLRPPLKLISRVIAGKKVYNTEYIPPKNSIHFAFKWLIDAAKTRDHKTIFAKNLALELTDAFNKKGLAYKTKLEYNTTLKENYRRRRTKIRKFKRRRKQPKFVKKLFRKNSRLKINGLKKRCKSKKHQKTRFAAIKRKISPLFRKRTILNYLLKKHQKHQKYLKFNLQKTHTNVIYTRFNIKQKLNKRNKIKKTLNNVLRQKIKTKFKHERFLTRKIKQTQIKLTKMQLNAEKRYLIKLDKQWQKKNKQLQKKQQKASKFMQKLARNLRIKLNTIINTQKPKNSENKKLNVKRKKKNKKQKSKISFFHKLLFYAQSKVFKQKIKRIIKKGLTNKNKKLMAIERILRKFGLRKKLKIMIARKVNKKLNWRLTKKTKFKKLRFISKPKSLNAEIRNKKLAKTYLNFFNYRRGLKKFKKQLALIKQKTKKQQYKQYVKSKSIIQQNNIDLFTNEQRKMNLFKEQPENVVMRLKSTMNLWLKDNKHILNRKQKHMLKQKLGQYLQYKNIRTRIKYLSLTKNLRKRKRKHFRKSRRRVKRKTLRRWQKFTGKLRTYKRKLRKKAVKKLRKRLLKWRKHQKISLPIYHTLRKKKLINRKQLIKKSLFLFNRLRTLIRRSYPPGLRSMVYAFSKAMFKIRYLPLKIKRIRIGERCGKINGTRKYRAANNFVRKVFLKYPFKKTFQYATIKLRLRKATNKYKQRKERIKKKMLKLTKKTTKWHKKPKWHKRQLKQTNKKLRIKFRQLIKHLNSQIALNTLAKKDQQNVDEDINKLDKVFWKTISRKAVKLFNEIIAEPLYKRNFSGKPKKRYLKIALNFNYNKLQRKKIRKKRKSYKKLTKKITLLKTNSWPKIITTKRNVFNTYNHYFYHVYVKHYFCRSLKRKNGRD